MGLFDGQLSWFTLGKLMLRSLICWNGTRQTLNEMSKIHWTFPSRRCYDSGSQWHSSTSMFLCPSLSLVSSLRPTPPFSPTWFPVLVPGSFGAVQLTSRHLRLFSFWFSSSRYFISRSLCNGSECFFPPLGKAGEDLPFPSCSSAEDGSSSSQLLPKQGCPGGP